MMKYFTLKNLGWLLTAVCSFLLITKPGSDYLTTLPNNIISDFKDFCDRFKMNSGDREQLADLIKKAKEENPTI